MFLFPSSTYTYTSMEKPSSSSSNTIPLNPLDLFPLYVVFDLKHYISSFFHSKFQSFDNSNEIITSDEQQKIIKHIDLGVKKNNSSTKSNEKSNDDDHHHHENFLLGEDINMVMERLGIEHSKLEGEELKRKWGCREICGIFEQEPSLEEVKEAFDVFDQNKDGFIDAMELQKVLINLGLNQGYELNQCRNMIRAFDDDNDGRIDFNEFVRFMLNTL